MSDMRLFKRAALGGTAFVTMFACNFSQGAQAQERASGGVGDIVVTAERRSERLQDTPLSITAFNAEALNERGIANVRDLTKFAPNVEISPTKRPAGGGGAIAAFIRGVGTGDFQLPTDPAVGLYVDGVYIARTIGGLMSVADVDRIEVLKGPQGTLFGRNALGGAISIVTETPRLEGAPTGKLEARLGNYGRRDVVGSINAPLVDGVLGGKLSLASIHSDGWQKRIQTGEKIADEDVLVARAGLRYAPSTQFEVSLAADYTRQRNQAQTGQLIDQNPLQGTNPRTFNQVAAPVLNPGLGLPAGSGIGPQWATSTPRLTNETAPLRDDLDSGGVSVIGVYNFNDNFRVKSITAARYLDALIQVAGDGTPYPTNQTRTPTVDSQYSQEFELSGEAWDGRLKMVGGLYWFSEVGKAFADSQSFHGIYEVNGNNTFALDTQTVFRMSARSRAVFGQASFEVIPRVELVLGGRYNVDEKTFLTSVYKPQNRTTTQRETSEDADWSVFTPRVGLNWRATDDILLYTSYAEGFKSGGFGSALPTGGVPPYGPENLETYEIGAKTSWFDNRLVANAAAFFSTYDGVQVTVLIPPNSFRTTQNAGTAKIDGFELDVTAVPFDNFRINANVGYTHGRYESVTASAVAASAANGVVHGPGTKLTYVPDWSGGVGAEYSFPLNTWGELTVRGDWSYKGLTELTLADPTSFQEAYSLYSARIGFVPAFNENLEFSVQGTNLADKTYYYYRNFSRTTGNNLGQAGDPRMIYAQMRYRF